MMEQSWPFPGRDNSVRSCFVAAYIAHHLSGAPLIVYELDEWRASLGDQSGFTAKALERLFHRSILRSAHSVWVVSDEMASQFRERFGVEARVLPHCVDVETFSGGRCGERANRDVFRIAFTGAIYGPSGERY